MATRKHNLREDESGKTEQQRHMADSTPNPQGQQKVIHMPRRSDQRKHTSQNIPQNPSTVGNRMDPSVTTSMEDNTALDSDSMFNEADPQARELVEENNARNRSRLRRRIG
jgi:predicted lipid-binding transport protein (Tim44 family)